MALYLITYDLKTPGKDYAALAAALSGYGATKVLLSVWLLPSVKSASAIWDAINRDGNLDTNDRLLVTEVANEAAWKNLLASDATVQNLYRSHARK